MAGNDLANVGAAKEVWRRAWELTDQRVQKQLAPVNDKILGEYALEIGIEDLINGISAGMGCTASNPWSGDIFSLRLWADDGTPATGGTDPITGLPIAPVTPGVPPSISVIFELTHQGAPFVRIPMIAGLDPALPPPSFTVTGDSQLADTTTVTESDTSGGANIPDPAGLALSSNGFLTALLPGDKIFATIVDVTPLGSAHYLGIELLCRLRIPQTARVIVGP